jgi:integrase/recombinase XerD
MILEQHEVYQVFDLVAEVSRMPARDNLLCRFGYRAGMRVAEIAQLDLNSVLGPRGQILDQIRIAPHMTKGSRGRVIHMSPEIRVCIEEFLDVYPWADWFAISPRDGRQMRPATLAAHFDRLYKQIGFVGCTSHTGRATCITEMARSCQRHGGSLRDVQYFAGHKSLETTARYIGLSDAQPAMVRGLGGQFNKERRFDNGRSKIRQGSEHASASRTARLEEHEAWTAGLFHKGPIRQPERPRRHVGADARAAKLDLALERAARRRSNRG